MLFYYFVSNSFFFQILFYYSFFFSIQSNVHYDTSNNLGAAYRRMKSEGKNELVLGEGEWRVEEGDLDGYGRFVLDKSTKIIGQGRGLTTLVGVGLWIQGNKSDGIVEIHDLTIKGGEEGGLYASWGMKVITRGCTIEECEEDGVWAYEADITCDDLQVIGCGRSGVCAWRTATITLSGQSTSIQGNVTRGYSYYYGLHTWTSSSSIHLVHPLTKKQISKKNGGGGNWGGRGTIEQIGGGSPGETKSDVTTPSVSLFLFFSFEILGRLVLLLVLLMVDGSGL